MSQFYEDFNRLRCEVRQMQDTGQFHEAVWSQHALVNLLISHLGTKHEVTLDAMLLLGYLHRRCGQFAAAKYWYDQTLEHGVPALGEGHSTITTTYNNLGSMMYRCGLYDVSLSYYHKAIAYDLRYHGYTADNVSHFTNMASAWRGKGEFIVAAGLYRLGPWLKENESWLVPDATMINSCLRFGQMLSAASASNEESEQWLIRACDYVNAHGPYDPLADEALAAAAEYYALRGNLTRIPVLQHKLADMTNRLGPEHPEVGHMHLVVGKLLLMAGRIEEASSSLSTASHVISASLGKEHILYWMTLVLKARLHLSRNESIVAESLLYECIDNMQAILGPSHPWLAEPFETLAVTDSTMSDPSQSDHLKSRAADLRVLPDNLTDFPALARYCQTKGYHLETIIFSHAAERQGVSNSDRQVQAAAMELRGGVSAALGWATEATAVFDDAAAIWLDLGDKPRLARCLLRHVEALTPLLPDDGRIAILRDQAVRIGRIANAPGP